MKNTLVILLLFLSTVVQATTYYISPSGNNANAGSSAAPWKTLAYACSQAKTSGDIIHVNAGTYPETSVSYLVAGVSIEGEGASSIITSNISSEYTYTITLNSSEGTNGNQHISNIKMDGLNLTGWGAIGINGRKNVKIYNCTFVNFYGEGVMFNGGAGYLSRAPSIYPTGNEFHDNIVTNCAFYSSASNYGSGNLMIGGQDGILIYNNTITQIGRANNLNGYCIKYYSEGYNKGVKIYNNTLVKSPAAGPEPTNAWDFAIEQWNMMGGYEIYGNTIKGGVDLVNASKGSYAFAVDIHDNTIGFDTQSPGLDTEGDAGIRFESDFGRSNIYRNHFKNLSAAIYVSCFTGDIMSDLNIYYNLFTNLGNNLGGKGWALRFTPLPMSDVSNTVTNWNIWNNVIIGGASNSTAYGIQLPHGKVSNFSVRNNIITGFDQGAVQKSAYGTGSNVSIENNIFYNNGNNNDPAGSVTYSSYTYQNNLKVDPLFVSSTDYRLQSSSPAIGKGLGVGLSADYIGVTPKNPPSIGAYESGSAPAAPVAPVYQNAVVQNATPLLMEMTYDQPLAVIAPVASSFSVLVNSVARAVNVVTVSGSKVQLTLASAVVNGEVVTVSYTKPASNPLQTVAGGQAASISMKSVTNNCSSSGPVYLSSAVQNATPSILEMTYSQSLATIVPAGTAFIVKINSVARTVNTVAVSGTKVQLTLASAVKFGEIVTVSYTKPATNPLQTATGGIAANISDQITTNSLVNPTKDVTPVTISMTISPTYVHSIVNILLGYSSTPTTALSPQIIRISNLYGRLMIEKLIVVGSTTIQIPLNLSRGYYYVKVLAAGKEMASKRIRVY